MAPLQVCSILNATAQSRNGTVLIMLNPYASSAWLDPQTASLFDLLKFLLVSSLAILVYDILKSLPEDYVVLFKTSYAFPKVVFVLSRLAALACMLVATLAHTIEVPHCDIMKYAGCALYTIAHATTGYLFFVRVCGTGTPYCKTRVKILVLFALGFVVGGSISSSFAVETARIEPTRYCMTRVKRQGSFLALAFVAQAVYDLLVCLLITCRLPHIQLAASPIQQPSFQGNWLGYARHPVQQIGQRLLQESQVYLIVALILKITATVWFYSFGGFNHSSGGLNIAFVFFDMVVVNILATNIFRKMKLGKPGITDLPGSPFPSSPSTHIIHLEQPVHPPLSRRADARGQAGRGLQPATSSGQAERKTAVHSFTP